MKKNLLALAFLSCVLGLLTFSAYFTDSEDEVKKIDHHFSFSDFNKTSALNDTFSIAGLYVLGRVPYPSGEPDTIRILIKQIIPNSTITFVYVYLFNDSCNGNLKEVARYDLSDPGIYEATLDFVPEPMGVKKNDFVLVQAIKGDSAHSFDCNDTNIVSKSYHYRVTTNTYNHADSSVANNAGTGFSGRTGNLLAGFRNKNSSPIFVSSIDHAFLDSSGGGSKPYRIVVYGDNGSGKPGTLLYLSSALTSPAGTGSTVRVTHNIPSPVSISPGNKFYVGYRQTSTSNIKAAYQNENPIRPKSFFYSSPDTSNTWFDFLDSAKSFRLDISAIIQYGQLNLTALPQGFYDNVLNKMVKDTLRVYLRNNVSPYTIKDSSKAFLDSTGFGKFYFTNSVNSTPYYLEAKHRNSIRTWSNSAQSFSGNSLTYNFTTASSQAYGNNMILKGSKYCIYSGECNNSGSVNLADIILVFNDAVSFSSGYLKTDLNGDDNINLTDILICTNNSSLFVSEIFPP